MEKVSVVIPVFNGASTIGDAIDSVADQTHQNIELIVVDDGSSDNSVDSADSAILHRGISGRVIRRPDTVARGAGGCRNYGVSLSSGHVVAFLDADDMWSPSHVERAIRAFSVNDVRMGAYSAMCEQIAVDGSPSGKLPARGFPALGLQDALPFLLQGMFVPTVTLCVRTREFRNTRGFSETLHCYEDWWLVLQLAARTRFFFDNEVGCKIRIGAGSLTRAPATATDGEHLRMSDEMYSDQLRLYADAERAGFLDNSQLDMLRSAVVDWNVRQLNDLVSSGQMTEAARIFRALKNSQVMDLVGPICIRTLSGVGTRAAAKLKRAIFGVE